MSKKDENKPKSIVYMLHEISNEICDHYCKYPDMYVSKHPEAYEEDLLEDMMYMEICAKCPLMRIDQVI